MKRRRRLGILLVSLLLFGLILYSVLRPDPEEKEFLRLKSTILEGPQRGMDESAGRDFREALKQLSPETRERLFREVMRHRLEEARAKIAKMTHEEKLEQVDRMIAGVRENFSKLSEDERARIKGELNSPEGKKRFKKALEFYAEEFTPEEKQLLDPFAEEILIHLNAL